MRKILVILSTIGALLVGTPSAAGAQTPTCRGEPATIVGTEGRDVLVGTSGPDVIVALGGSDVIRALGGDDIVCGGPGRDRIVGGPGDDILLGESGRDRILGNRGDDEIRGGGGNDRLLDGGPGSDLMVPGRGVDRCVIYDDKETYRNGPTTFAWHLDVKSANWCERDDNNLPVVAFQTFYPEPDGRNRFLAIVNTCELVDGNVHWLVSVLNLTDAPLEENLVVWAGTKADGGQAGLVVFPTAPHRPGEVAIIDVSTELPEGAPFEECWVAAENA